MTWYPLQAAIKMSTIPGAIRATLDILLDHINPDPDDPTRPETLTVWESRELLAAESGFSEVTINDHLKRLRGEKDLSKGRRVTVLTCTEEARSHRAARYDILPAALDALVDPVRLEAFEARTPRGTHASSRLEPHRRMSLPRDLRPARRTHTSCWASHGAIRHCSTHTARPVNGPLSARGTATCFVCTSPVISERTSAWSTKSGAHQTSSSGTSSPRRPC
jgi:hypothetical protein